MSAPWLHVIGIGDSGLGSLTPEQAAVLARAAPLGVLASALLMAVILNGGIILQTQGLTTSTVLAVTGLILLFSAIGDEIAHYRVVRAAPQGA